MRTIRITGLSLLCLGACAAHASYAAADEIDGFRCRNSLVYEGLSSTEVIGKCGEPATREVLAEPIRARFPSGAFQIVGTRTIEHWIYEREPGQFPARLTFEEGELRKIELLSTR
jgi:Protein of unknown function (DUF2845)